MLDAVPIREVIGANVRRVRENRGLSQPQFGRTVGEFVNGRPWSRQTVSAMERGDRAFTVDDLLLLAYVLEVPPTALLLIPTDLPSVQVGAHVFGPDELGAAGWQSNPTTDALEQLASTVGALQLKIKQLADEADEAAELAAGMSVAATLLRHAQALEAAGADNDTDAEMTQRAVSRTKGER
jgi:transcriptional regulator with XRE-family HTH domain